RSGRPRFLSSGWRSVLWPSAGEPGGPGLPPADAQAAEPMAGTPLDSREETSAIVISPRREYRRSAFSNLRASRLSPLILIYAPRTALGPTPAVRLGAREWSESAVRGQRRSGWR